MLSSMLWWSLDHPSHLVILGNGDMDLDHVTALTLGQSCEVQPVDSLCIKIRKQYLDSVAQYWKMT